MKQRSDYGAAADQYYAAIDGSIRGLGDELRTLILLALPDATESIKWGVPVYERDGLVCSVRGGKGYVALQFFEAGIALDDPDHLLEGTGQKMRHVKIRSGSDMRKKLFGDWIRQASQMRGS